MYATVCHCTSIVYCVVTADLLSPFCAISQLGIMTTTAAGLEQILPWLYYHRTLGVEMFFIFAEGHVTQPENAAVLATIPVRAQWEPSLCVETDTLEGVGPVEAEVVEAVEVVGPVELLNLLKLLKL